MKEHTNPARSDDVPHRTLHERRQAATERVLEGYGWIELNADADKVALLLHGVTGGKDDMLVLAEQYAALGYAVYCPDLPGHGDSEMIEVPNFAVLGRWLAGYIRVLGVMPDLIVSNSYASAVTYSYLQQGFAPEKMHIILGCPTPGVAKMSRLLDKAAQKLPNRATWRVYTSRPARVFRTKYLYKGSDTSSYLWLVESERRKRSYIAPDVTSVLSNMLFVDSPYDLPSLPDSLQKRITVVLGEHDNVVSRAGRSRLRQILPHARFVSAGPAGHILHFEAVDALIDAHRD